MADDMSGVRARILALIHPNRAETAAQIEALDRAAACQAAWEAANGGGLAAARRGVQHVTAGNYSETYFQPAGGAEGPSDLCPEARALLFNAGLLKRTLPCATRL